MNSFLEVVTGEFFLQDFLFSFLIVLLRCKEHYQCLGDSTIITDGKVCHALKQTRS